MPAGPLLTDPHPPQPNHDAVESAYDPHDPYRRCVVCRNKAPRLELLRFVALPPDLAITFDARHRAPGRGAHVCPRLRCLQRAADGALARSLKLPATAPRCVPAAELISLQLLPSLLSFYRDLLSLGRKSGQLLQGSSRVEGAARTGRLAAYLIASDASAPTQHKITTIARCRHLLMMSPILSRHELGLAFGRSDAVVLGWCHGPLFSRAHTIEQQLLSLDPSLSSPTPQPPPSPPP
jgi:uncharacterized protein